MSNLRYFTRRTVGDLRDNVADLLDWYYAPQGQVCPRYMPSGAWRESKVVATPLGGRLNADRPKPSECDADHAMLVFQSMSDLTPQQAVDERLWVYLSHFECADYVAARWLRKRPTDAEKAAVRVRNHFFARDTRAVIRDHGLSRLWWLGKIAHDVRPADPGLFLEVVLHRQDVRSALLERPSVSMNIPVLQLIFMVMLEHWEGERALFRRKTFRAWMMTLNRQGGFVLLDAVPEDALLRLLRTEADDAIEAEGG